MHTHGSSVPACHDSPVHSGHHLPMLQEVGVTPNLASDLPLCHITSLVAISDFRSFQIYPQSLKEQSTCHSPKPAQQTTSKPSSAQVVLATPLSDCLHSCWKVLTTATAQVSDALETSQEGDGIQVRYWAALLGGDIAVRKGARIGGLGC